MRITRNTLDQTVTVLNAIARTLVAPHKDGVAQVGNYHLDSAYGRWALHQVTEDGGSRDVLRCGYRSSRELYFMICAYMSGIEDAKRITRKA